MIRRLVSSIARLAIHGRDEELWQLNATIARLCAERDQRDARIAQMDRGWADDRRRLAEARSLNNLARDVAAGVTCPDTPEGIES